MSWTCDTKASVQSRPRDRYMLPDRAVVVATAWDTCATPESQQNTNHNASGNHHGQTDTGLEGTGRAAGPSVNHGSNEGANEYGGGAGDARVNGEGQENMLRRRNEMNGNEVRQERQQRRGKRREERLAQKSAARIASLNMNGFGCLTRDHPDNKWGKIYRLMSERRIGVLLLQETHLTEQRRVDVQRMFADRIKIYASAHPTAPTQREGVAIVINKKIISAKAVTSTVIVQGRAIQITTPWKGGEERNILCIYAPTSAGAHERRQFFKEVKEWYETHPTHPKPHVVAGDFNVVEDQIDRVPVSEGGADVSLEALDDLKSALGLLMVDGWRATYPNTRDFTFQRTSDGRTTMSRLDRIYVTSEASRWAREWEIEPVGVKTDHNLVSVLITTPSAPVVGKGRPVFPLNLLKDKKLAKLMKQEGMKTIRELDEIHREGRTQERNAQTALMNLKKNWLIIARKYEKTIIPGIVKETKELEKRAHYLQDLADPPDDARTVELGMITTQIRVLKARRIKQQQVKSRARYRVLGESPTKYWTSLNKEHAPRELIPAFEREGMRDGAGEKVYETNTVKMAEMARKHHDELQQDGPDVRPREQRQRDMQTALNSLQQGVSEEQADELAAPIDWEDCELALKFAKTGTAPGLDGIQYEVWKAMHARFVEDSRHEDRQKLDVLRILQAAFRDVQVHGVCPGSTLAEGWMSPIYKEKGELTKVVNYRPITLLNTDYKLLSKIMAIKLAVVAPDIVHEAQAGFVPGRRLHNHTQLARMMMSWAETKEVNGAIVALDQEKAYDKIDHEYLWAVLERLGIPRSFINMIKTLYASAETSVVINGVTSKKYRIYRGVRQGDPLSCLLFDLAIEPLSAMIRASNLRGFEIPKSVTALKATLFADDTTVYLAEEDDFQTLQDILDTWCSAAKAKFNIVKTEIIPIGTKEYRVAMAETYAATGKWKNYPQGIHVAREGEAVRILGAFFGNGVEQAGVWTTKLAKIEGAMNRWKKGSVTVNGKKQVVQMVVASMSQFMANVQRMPEHVTKRLTKLIRNYIWDDKHIVPVSMDRLCMPYEAGGLNLLDLEARNEAIDVMWLRAYLNMGAKRQLWALVADDLFATAVPKNVFPRERELRENVFTQSWEPKLSELPQELRALVKVAKKYGLQQEGLAFSKQILRQMPIWAHRQIDKKALRRLALKSSVTTCLKYKHKLRTVGECEGLASALTDPTHRRANRCTCTNCEAVIVKARCAHPDRCFERARKLMDLLPSKWDPRGVHPEDYEEEQMRAAWEAAGEATVFDRSVTVKGTLGETFRIFTDSGPVHNERIDMRVPPSAGALTVATDGSCSNNGRGNAKAGAGVFVSPEHPMNRAVRLPASLEQTNQSAEIAATLIASREIGDDIELTQETDSRTVMEALTKFRSTHEDTGYILQRNAKLTKATVAALRARKAHTMFRWVKGHAGHEGNEGADKLAGEAAGRATGEDINTQIPAHLTVSGAKLSAVTQKIAYRAICEYKNKRSTPRRSTERTMQRIMEEFERTTGVQTTDQEVWMSLRKPHVSRECRQFLWKTVHDAFMVGSHWLKPRMAPQLQERAVCKICRELDSMEHILMKCKAVGRGQIWSLVKKTWERTKMKWYEPSWGTVLNAAAVQFQTGNGGRLHATENLWTILWTESTYLVWKLRCERVIANDGKQFTVEEVVNRWHTTVNARLTLDRNATAEALGKRALRPEV
ncbi:Transposon TX1 uncharacterized 149 kDa protein, partial [Trametes pubescens]